MAVPNNYIDKIKKDGDSRMISPAADMVRVDNDNFEGTDLDEVLDEVAQAIGEAGEGGYAPPAGGIPKTDLASDVQTSLGKADTALQSFTETDPTVPSWAKQQTKPTYTAQEVGALPANTDIPSKTSDLENNSGFVTSTTMTNALAGKQDTLTFDNAPTAGSNNPVKSGGIKTAIDNATPSIDPTTKKWIVGGQLTDVVAEGQDGQDGNSGVASADGVESVNNLNGGTTDTAERVYVLGANQGKVIKDILDKTYRSDSTGDTSTIIVEQEVQMKAGTGEGTLGATIVSGQRRPGTGGMNVVAVTDGAQNTRRTVNKYYTRTGDSKDIPFPDEFTIALPSGMTACFCGSDVLNTNDTNNGVQDVWVGNGASVSLPDKNYITINFAKIGNANFSDADTASLISTFAIVYSEEQETEVTGPTAGKAMEFINADGTVAKTVYCKEDNAANVQVYTKAAVDSKIGSGLAYIGDGISRTPVQMTTAHGMRHPIGEENGGASDTTGINHVKTNQYTVARATTAHYYRVSGYDLVDQSLVDGGSTESAATIKGAIDEDGILNIQIPSGIMLLCVHSKLATKVSSSSDYNTGSGWKSGDAQTGIIAYDLNENDAIDYTDYPYIAFNFKKSDDGNFTDDSAAAVGNGTYIIPSGVVTVNGKNEQVGIVGANGTELSIFGSGTKMVEVPTVEKVQQMLGSPNGIIARNQEAINRIIAARKHFDMVPAHMGTYTVYNHEKNFCIAHGSDFHVDVQRLANFRDFVDGVDMIDAAVLSGDLTSNGSDTEINAMMGVDFERVQPIRCIGNHDRDGGKTLAQLASALELEGDDEDDASGYFYKDYNHATNANNSNQKIRFIVLNRYDTSATAKADAQKDGHWSQSQIDWFIELLDDAITNGHHVIVVMHAIDNAYNNSSPRMSSNDKGFWQRYTQASSQGGGAYTGTEISGTIIEDIIAAFRTGGSISETYTHHDGTSSVAISHSFSSAGNFVAYIVGHYHIDRTGYSAKYPDQLYLMCPASGCVGLDQSSQYYPVGTQMSDLPRAEGTKTEDCFNVYAIDTVSKVVKVVRVGADMNDLMEKREVACFEYEPTIS